MKKKELTELLIKEGWMQCRSPVVAGPFLLIHPNKHICYRASSYAGPTKSFFIPTKEAVTWLSNPKNRSVLHAYIPDVYRYISVGAWDRLEVRPAQKLVVDKDEFLAFNYGV